MDPQDNPPSSPSSPGPTQHNRHERRRLAALQRRQDRPAVSKPLGMKVLSSGLQDPLPEPADPRVQVLQNISRWSVEGINEDGTFLAFLAQFKNGEAVVVLDPMDELHAEEVVRAAVQNRAEKGFIGMIVPCLREGKIQLDAQRNSLRVKDMEKVVKIATNAVFQKFNKFKEQESRDAANRIDTQPAVQPPFPDGASAAGSPGTDPPASSGAGEPAAPGSSEAEPVR